MGLIWTILIGLIAGWLAGKIMRGSGYGALMDILLGIVGGLLGRFILAPSASTAVADSSAAF